MTPAEISEFMNELYAELPSVNCSACGECCVCLSCTLLEFIHTLNGLSPQSFKELLHAKPAIDVRYEGNLLCPFKPHNLCTIHPVRPGACRLFGIPSLDSLEISNLENCRYGTTTVGAPADAAFVNEWIEKLYTRETMLYPVMAEPFFVKGFNLFCWLDIFFDQSINEEPFASIRSILAQTTPLATFSEAYQPQTNLSQKIKRIEKIRDLIDLADIRALTEELVAIRDDYPLTGTYYYEEANLYLNHLTAMLPETRGQS